MKTWLIAILLLGVAMALVLIAWLYKRKSGLPAGRVIYADTDQLQVVPKPLYDPVLHLVGKPDYVIREKDGHLIPVDFKSMAGPETPYDSHVFQVLAYCYLIEQKEKRRPRYGILRYQDKSFEIPYRDEDRANFLNLIQSLRETEQATNPPARSHHMPARCRSCGYQEICEEKLIS